MVLGLGDLERSQRLPDRDAVRVTYEDIDPETTKISLVLARPLTWWKGIQTLNGTNAEIAFTQTEGFRTGQIGNIFSLRSRVGRIFHYGGLF